MTPIQSNRLALLEMLVKHHEVFAEVIKRDIEAVKKGDATFQENALGTDWEDLLEDTLLSFHIRTARLLKAASQSEEGIDDFLRVVGNTVAAFSQTKNH